jgi:hypothetical protein
VPAFQAWRAERARERSGSDQHSLFREYGSSDGDGRCCASHGALTRR